MLPELCCQGCVARAGGNRVVWVVEKSDVLKLTLVSILWGGQFIAARIATSEALPFTAACLRFSIATIALLVIHLLREKRFVRLSLGQWGWIVLLGISGVFLFNFLFFSALAIAPAGRSSVVVAMTPAMVSVSSIFLFRERFSPLRIVGLLIALFGVSWAISGGNPLQLLRGGIGRGDLYLFAATLCWATFSLSGKVILKRLSPRVAITYACLVGTAALLVSAGIEGGLHHVPQFSARVWLSLLYLGLFGTALGFVLYYDGIGKIGPSKTTIFINLVPIWAMVFAAVILGENITLALVLGAAMVIGGVFLTSRF